MNKGLSAGGFLSDQLERAKVNVQMSLLHHAGFGSMMRMTH